jgi:Imidazolonepropionase and related amidohydrolases
MKRVVGAIGAALAAIAGLGAVNADTQGGDALLIRNARVFDGTGAAARQADVLIEGERIVAVGPKLALPRGGKAIDAHGQTLLPGLHDLHTHLRSPGYPATEDLGKAYAGYLLRGVTTVNDYSVSAEMIAPIREMTRQPGGIWSPHLNQAIRTGVPGGHGTEYGWGDFFTMKAATPRAAHLVMQKALPYRPDVIKAFTDGWRYGRGGDLNDMNQETLAAMVKDAHKAGVPVVTHTVTLGGAKIAAGAGVDAVVHGVGDAPVDDALIERMKASGTAYVPTMVVYEPQETRSFSIGEWASLNPCERAAEEKRRARSAGSVSDIEARRWTILQQNLRAMHAAGVPVGVGTDAGIGGVYHGPAAIRETIWLTRLGFTPAQALVAATRTSAEIMGQGKDHGTIAPGMRADVILVKGRPDEEIEDIWNVARVWVSGREVPLGKMRQRIATDDLTPLPVVRMTGPIWTGRRADGRTELGTLPVDATDPGADHSHIDFVHPVTLEGGEKPVFMAASFGAAPRPFAQLVLPLTRGGIELADARAFSGIAFTVKGAGDYRLRLESYGLGGGDGFGATFKAGADRAEVRLPFSAFASKGDDARLDLARLRALRFELSGKPGGTAWLELGNVRFY